ncbi:helix-turn-helix domain-containing protein [Pandoraea eparura]|uniref:helix-turn-helix domain-containing protein n=1 Tax=Pandoraea eparura TaxID=2508291 RepID=UPI00124112E0
METKTPEQLALAKAVEIVGGQSALALALREWHPTIQQPHVAKWLKSPNGCPADYCPDIERLTKGQVTCEQLRPRVNWAVLRHTFTLRRSRRSLDATEEGVGAEASSCGAALMTGGVG